MRTTGERARGYGAHGFTLIEVMVVILVICILLGVLIPALNSVREAARRGTCLNNLAQIGIALQTYHDIHQAFPAAYQTRIGGDPFMGAPDPVTRDTGPGWGFLTQILPELDQANLYHSFNLKLPCWSVANSTSARISVGTYLCPSVLDKSTTFDVKGTNGATLATFSYSHYVSNAGRADAWSAGVDDLSTIPAVDGPFYRNSVIGIADIQDGTTHTILVGERRPSTGDATWVGVVPGAILCSRAGAGAVGPGGAVASCRSAGALVGAHSGPSPFESPSVVCLPNGALNHADSMASGHPGGSNVLFGDGSVRVVQAAIAPAIWVALSTRNGGEMISEVW